jgi:hypothetical protein
VVLPEMNNFPLTDGCNCGAIRFEVTEPLVMASYCLWGNKKRRFAGLLQSPLTDSNRRPLLTLEVVEACRPAPSRGK